MSPVLHLELCSTARPRRFSREFRQRGEEALVLRRGAVGDADVAGVAERACRGGPRSRARPGRRRPRASSASPRSIQEKLAWVSAVAGQLAQPLLDPDPLDDRALDPAQRRRRWCRIASAAAAWARALTLNGWRTASTAARKLGRAERVADPQAGQAVALAEGAQDDQVGELGEQVEGRVGVVVGLELDVGLVEDDRHVRRDPLAEGGDLGRRDVGRRSGCWGCRRSAAGSRR